MSSGRLEVAKKIIRKKSRNKKYLQSAIKHGKLESIKLLIQKGGINVNKRRLNGMSPLHVAARYGQHKIIKFLIQHGANLDSVSRGCKKRRFCALHWAIRKNHIKCVKLLLDHGASISSKSKTVCSPIHFAVFKNRLTITKLLLDAGADINARFNNNFFKVFETKLYRCLWLDHNLPLLHYAILRKFIKMAELLLNYGADVDLKSSKEKTALMQAVEVRNFTLAEILIKEHDVNVNDRDIGGKPVLHFMVLNANTEKSMYSKEDYALYDEKMDILELLVSYGADVNAHYPKDTVRTSVVHYMIKYGFSFGVGFLFHNSDFDFNTIDLLTVYSGEYLQRNITPDIAYDGDHMEEIRYELELILEKIVSRAIDYDMIGLPFDRDLFLLMRKPNQYWINADKFKEKMDLYRDDLAKQINYMKEKKVGDSNITIWHLFTGEMNELVKLMSNKNVRNFLGSEDFDFQTHYQYREMFTNRLIDAQNEKLSLERSTEFLFNLFINQLPYNCCEKIISYFNSQELDQSLDTLACNDDVLNEKIRASRI